MNINHRAEAEKHLATAARHLSEHPEDMRIAEVAAYIGQGYATLAASEGSADTQADLRDANTHLRQQLAEMRRVAVWHTAEALAANDLTQWRSAIGFAKALDEAGLNIDKAIDERMEDLDINGRAAWAGPSGIAEEDLTLAQSRAMRLVIAVHLAEMLLDDQGDEVKRWARGIAFELDRIGVNIDAAIEARVQQLAPGTPPVQPSNAPF